MRNKILAVIVALGGFASLAVVSATAAQASTHTVAHVVAHDTTTTTPADELCPAGTTSITYCSYYCPSGTLVGVYCEASTTTVTTTTPEELCPAGTTNIAYCTAYCPSGTLVGQYCETASTTVLPQGPPTLFDWVLWGAKLKLFYKGPALKFHVKSGINGAPYLRTLKLTLPNGLTFASKQKRTVAVNGPILKLGKTSVTFTFRSGDGSVLVYLKNGSLVESSALRAALASGKIKSLKFPVTVTDLSGKTTSLSFQVTPNS